MQSMTVSSAEELVLIEKQKYIVNILKFKFCHDFEAEVEFVTPVTPGGSVKFLPVV